MARFCSPLFVPLFAAGITISTLIVAPSPSYGASIAQTEAQISALSAQLNIDTQRSEAAANKYDADQAALAADNAAVANLQYQVQKSRAAIAATTHVMVKDVVRAFVDGASQAQVESLFNLNVTAADARQVYVGLAVGNLAQLRNQLFTEHHALSVSLTAEAKNRENAIAQANSMHALLAENEALQQQTQDTLNSVKARYVTEMIAYEVSAGEAAARASNTTAEEQAVNAASQIGGTAAANQVIQAEQAVIAAMQPKTPAYGPGGAGSAAGEAAVHAAESQLGLPYIWGGETPGQGFDCSGLVQWAWGRAGVSIPRTTETQWAALPKVSLQDLQPGDLIYYYNLDGDGAVDHVVMYVGSGPYGTSTIIQAAHTGTNISYAPLFTFGLYGVARP